MVTGNVSVFQKTGDTSGLLCFTLELNWQFIKFKSVKKYCHKALKGKKSGVCTNNLNLTVNNLK